MPSSVCESHFSICPDLSIDVECGSSSVFFGIVSLFVGSATLGVFGHDEVDDDDEDDIVILGIFCMNLTKAFSKNYNIYFQYHGLDAFVQSIICKLQ